MTIDPASKKRFGINIALAYAMSVWSRHQRDHLYHLNLASHLHARRKPKMQTRAKLISLVFCIIVIMGMWGCAGSQTSTSTGEYIDDSVIATKAKTALLADEEVSGMQVEVEAFKGVVQLSGFVDSQAQAQKAEQIVRAVDGVKEVKNSIVVK
jgi:hyperosmotically inducible protein